MCVDSSSETEELLFEGNDAAVNDLIEAESANRVNIEQGRRFRAQ